MTKRSDAMVAAKALLTISKKAQNGTLKTADYDDLPEAYHGWLVPQEAKEAAFDVAGEDGTGAPHDFRRAPRLLVYFLADLGEAVQATVRSAAVPAVTDRDDCGVPVHLQALVDACEVWHTSQYGKPRVLPPPGDTRPALTDRAKRALARTLDTQRFVPPTTVTDLLPLRARRLDQIAGSLRAALEDSDLRVPFEQLLGPELDVHDLFGLAVDAAMGRYPDPENDTKPVAMFIADSIRRRSLPDAGLCPEGTCSQVEGQTPDCQCWHQFCQEYRIPADPKYWRGRKHREVNVKGHVAVDIAAWQLAHLTWAVPSAHRDRSYLAVPPLAVPPVAGGTTPQDRGWAALGALIALHSARFQVTGRYTDDDLYLLGEAAAAIDLLDDPSAIAIATSIASGAIHAVITRSPEELGDEGILHLAGLIRTTVGGLRELRQPAQIIRLLGPTSEWLADRPVGLHTFRLLEAAQDLQLGLQRRRLWTSAQYAFEIAKERLNMTYLSLPSGNADVLSIVHQKANEISEQYHLGRYGSLLLHAEALLTRRDYPDVGRQLDVAERMYRQLDGDLARLESFALSEAPTVDVIGFLRWTPRWRAMPTIMKYRCAVDRALLSFAACDDREDRRRLVVQARGAASSVETLIAELALVEGSEVTRRQIWEYHRTRLLHALVDPETLRFDSEVDIVAGSGADDGKGDYVLPILNWAQTVPGIAAQFGPDELPAAYRRIVDSAVVAPRLPDMRAIQA